MEFSRFLILPNERRMMPNANRSGIRWLQWEIQFLLEVTCLFGKPMCSCRKCVDVPSMSFHGISSEFQWEQLFPAEIVPFVDSKGNPTRSCGPPFETIGFPVKISWLLLEIFYVGKISTKDLFIPNGSHCTSNGSPWWINTHPLTFIHCIFMKTQLDFYEKCFEFSPSFHGNSLEVKVHWFSQGSHFVGFASSTTAFPQAIIWLP